MIEKIENIDKLAEALGSHKFYNFHDAEIVSIKFDRTDSVTVEVVLQVHRKIDEFEKDGEIFDRFKNFDAKFKFSNVYPFKLIDFNHQNVINELIIKKENDRFQVHFERVFGCDFNFECKKMELIGLQSFETENKRFIPEIEKMRANFLSAKKSEQR